MIAHVHRTAMIGGGLSYRVYVAFGDAPEHVQQGCRGYTIIHSHGQPYSDSRWLTWVEATTPLGHYDRETGWDRYEAYMAHEKAAEARMLAIAQQVYPELAEVTEWPILWLCGLPVAKETSDVRAVEVTP